MSLNSPTYIHSVRPGVNKPHAMPDSSATNFEDVDYELMGNLAFCIPMGVILVFTFSALRKPFLRFYATNSLIFPFK